MEIQLHRGTLHVRIIGSGTPILFLHGFSVDHHSLLTVMEPLFERKPGWQRIYVDLPGMGKSPGSDRLQSSDDMLAILLELIDQIIPNQPFLVAGESYGGYLAQGIVHCRFAHVCGLLLICPAIYADVNQRTLPPHTVLHQDLHILERLPSEDRETFARLAVVQTEEVWKAIQESALHAQSPDLRFLARLKKKYAFSFETERLPKPFDKPSLILTGRQDSITGFSDAWKLLPSYPRATFAVLDRAGHLLTAEQRTVFHALVSEWLDRVKEDLERDR